MSKIKKPKWDSFKHLNHADAVDAFHKAMHEWAQNHHWVRCVVTVKFKDGRNAEIFKFEPATKIHTYTLLDEQGYGELYGVEIPLSNDVLFKYFNKVLGISICCTPTKILEYTTELFRRLGSPVSEISVECEPLKD